MKQRKAEEKAYKFNSFHIHNLKVAEAESDDDKAELK